MSDRLDAHADLAAQATLRADLDALEDALARLGVTIRREPLPEGSSGGLVRLGAKTICFVPEPGTLAAQRKAMLDALRRIPSEAIDDVFLPPRARALRGEL